MKISRITLVTVILALAPISAYALPTMFQRAHSMSVSGDIPAAEGKVKFNHTDNGNTSIDLIVKYLAEPQSLQPPSNTYVAWVSLDKNSPAQNVGALQVNDHRKGTLKTVTSLQKFQLFVTAEANGQVQTPTGSRLIWTEYTTN
jgi:hypothetical protein